MYIFNILQENEIYKLRGKQNQLLICYENYDKYENKYTCKVKKIID